MHQLLYLLKTPVPIEEPKLIWMVFEKKKFLASTGI
jgi:hypothetical protein